MPAQVIPIVRICEGERESDWRSHFLDFMNTRLDSMEDGCLMNSLGDITSAITANRSEILGELALGLVRKRYVHLLEQEYCDCPNSNESGFVDNWRSMSEHRRCLSWNRVSSSSDGMPRTAGRSSPH